MLLRSIFHASLTCFSSSSFPRHHLKRAHTSSRFRNLTSLTLHPHGNGWKPCSNSGRMADVLDILGPFDALFPHSDIQFYVGSLKKCIKSKNVVMGSSVHAHLIKSGLDAEPLVSNVLLDAYAKDGRLEECVNLFDEKPVRDLVSWCTLISGYVSYGFDVEAFGFLKRMCESGLKPNHFIISSVLKGCSASGILELGLQVHGLIVKTGLVSDSFVEVGLVNVYAKCGALADALRLFYAIPVKSLVSWNAVISGCVQNGFSAKATDLCREMCRMGFIMDLVTLRIVASAGSALEMFGFCKNLHVYSIKIGLDADSFVVAEHVRLLAKLGEVEHMGKLVSTVKKPDPSLISLLISGYHINGHRIEAVKLVEELLSAKLNLNQGALVGVLNVCFYKEEGTQIHAHILKTGHESYLSVSNALVSMYIQCGLMKDAKIAFTKMPAHDIVSWTAIMAGHVQNFQFREALEVFHSFRKTGIILDRYPVATVINACTGLRAIDQGRQIHTLALKLGIDLSDFLTASLLHMYSKCGDIESASRLFSSVPSSHCLVSINVMLAGYCWNSQPEKALELFHGEYRAGLVPDQFSFSTVLGACADLRSVEMGQPIHSLIIKSGFESLDVVVGNAVINLYVKSGNIASACRSFYGMKSWDANSYAILMLGYVQNRSSKLALRLFSQMHRSGLRANPVAFASILRGCANLTAFELGKQIHASVLKMGFISDVYVANALVSTYARSGDTDGATKTLDEMLTRDDVQFNSIITGYSRTGNKERAFNMFELLQLDEVLQEYCSYVEMLRTSARTADLMLGTSAHTRMIHNGHKFDVSLGNPLFAMRSKNVCFKGSWNVFGKMVAGDMVLWNNMLSMCAENGCANKALEFFQEMQMEMIKGRITYIGIISGCSRVGLVDEELTFCRVRRKGQGLAAMEKHHSWMFETLRPTWELDDETHEFRTHMSGLLISDKTFLATCESHGNMKLLMGRGVMQQLIS